MGVKQLEWRKGNFKNDHHARLGNFHYCVYEGNDKCTIVWDYYNNYICHLPDAHNLDEAKKQVQQHFEREIKWCIDA